MESPTFLQLSPLVEVPGIGRDAVILLSPPGLDPPSSLPLEKLGSAYGQGIAPSPQHSPIVCSVASPLTGSPALPWLLTDMERRQAPSLTSSSSALLQRSPLTSPHSPLASERAVEHHSIVDELVGFPVAASPGAVQCSAGAKTVASSPALRSLHEGGDSSKCPIAGTNAATRCMVVEVDTIARIVPLQGTTCGICDAAMPSLPVSVCDGTDPSAAAAAAPVDRCFVDGRLVCETCCEFFGPTEFVPRYHVCINPLCRRKWKQLTPKVLPLFCPPCKRQLEEGIPGRQHLLEVTLVELMYRRWLAIWGELTEALGCDVRPTPPLGGTAPVGPRLDGSRGEGSTGEGDAGRPQSAHPGRSSSPVQRVNAAARTHWQEILAAFRDSFPSPPRAEDVRNWNSVHGRRKHYRGVIRRCHWRFVCTVEAKEELEEDLVTARRVPQGVREFPLLDWHQQLQDGQEVHFVAFPNPSVAERESVNRIVRLLNSTDGPPLPPGVPDGSALGALGKPVGSTTDELISAAATGKDVVPAGAEDAVNKSGCGSPLPHLCSSPLGAQNKKGYASEDMNLATSCSAFADLVQWSKESPEVEPTATCRLANPIAGSCELGDGAGPRMHLSLESALQLDAGAPPTSDVARPRHSQNSSGKCPRSSPQAVAAKTSNSNTHSMLQPWASQVPALASCRPQGALRSPPFRSPFPGKGRSPMICPRSPFAAYFDD
mmetsp:Transcript_120465/g.336079  ORF Transcript_120465/g.336079 Transcript_120465/m.336079 type:complete len:715 (-) Transcript_120465:202-2346(-)